MFLRRLLCHPAITDSSFIVTVNKTIRGRRSRDEEISFRDLLINVLGRFGKEHGPKLKSLYGGKSWVELPCPKKQTKQNDKKLTLIDLDSCRDLNASLQSLRCTHVSRLNTLESMLKLLEEHVSIVTK